MYKLLNPDSHLQSPGLVMCLHPHESERYASDMLSHQEEEEEEEAGEFLVIPNTGNTLGQADDAQWSINERHIHSVLYTPSSLTGCHPGVYRSQHQMKEITADFVEVSQHFTGGCCCEEPRIGTNGTYELQVHNFAPCGAESPYICYGVRRNMVVGVEVVEEVAVEDTLEVILEDVQADDLLDVELYNMNICTLRET